jgi:hypothetical protein
MLKAVSLHQVFVTLWIVLSCWSLKIDGTGATTSPESSWTTTTAVGRQWASSLIAARPSRLDASGFSIISNSRQNQQLSSLSSSRHDECRDSRISAPPLSVASRPNGILHRHRGGAAAVADRVKTMTARQMELFK